LKKSKFIPFEKQILETRFYRLLWLDCYDNKGDEICHLLGQTSPIIEFSKTIIIFKNFGKFLLLENISFLNRYEFLSYYDFFSRVRF